MDSDKSDNNTPKESKFWREDMIREKMKNMTPDPNDPYTE